MGGGVLAPAGVAAQPLHHGSPWQAPKLSGRSLTGKYKITQTNKQLTKQENHPAKNM